jgi:uncharacterized membrane protein YfcA
MITFELIIIVIALILGGFTKGLTGLGLPMVSIPIMANYIGTEKAVMILIIPTIVLNLWLAIINRNERYAIPELPAMLLFGVPGAILGATFLYLAPDKVLDTILAVWVLIYLLIRFLKKDFELSLKARRFFSLPTGFIAGALQSTTGISAPIIASYVDALGLNKRGYVYAVSVCFATLSCAHLLTLLAYKAISTEQLIMSLIAVIPAILFVKPGIYLRDVFSQKIFDTVIKAVLFIMAVQLIHRTWL